MSASNAFETNILKLILHNIALANLGDAAGLLPSAAAGVVYIGLHTADPGEAGDQSTSEATYTGYARVSVARITGKWTIANDTAENTDAITFGAATAGSNTITHFSIGSASTGAGNLFFSGALASSLAVSSGITPEFAALALDIVAA